jgi:hypothetical protein
MHLNQTSQCDITFNIADLAPPLLQPSNTLTSPKAYGGYNIPKLIVSVQRNLELFL